MCELRYHLEEAYAYRPSIEPNASISCLLCYDTLVYSLVFETLIVYLADDLDRFLEECNGLVRGHGFGRCMKYAFCDNYACPIV